jgi:membrane-anchored protein YejM (alkaline phosphatase superfamily)
MKPLLHLFFGLILFTSPSLAEPNVILITLDGIRWQEVFQDSAMPHLSGDLAREGVLLGDELNSSVRVSNPVNMSLPGYQSIFLGTNHFCFSNFCKSVRKETFPETLQNALEFSKNEMAAFASWEQIKRAYQREDSQLFLNAGLDPTGLQDPVHEALDQEQKEVIPKWNRPGIWSARFDRFTYAHALHFLKTKKPRFLYMGLLDADEWGHAGNYPEYLKTLQTYDGWIREIADFLDQSGDYGKNTLLIVTTDHGRGVGGDKWREHGIKHPESAKIWLYLRGLGIEPGAKPIPGTSLSHLSIKPMILRTFGLKYRKKRLKSLKMKSVDLAPALR